MPRFSIPEHNPLSVYDSYSEICYHIEPHSRKKDDDGNITDIGGIAETKNLCDLLNALHERAEHGTTDKSN